MDLITIFYIGASTIIAAILAEAFLRRNRTRKPLAELLKPNFGVEDDAEGNIKTPLGMEATDLSIIRASELLNPNLDHRDPRLKPVKRTQKENKHD